MAKLKVLLNVLSKKAQWFLIAATIIAVVASGLFALSIQRYLPHSPEAPQKFKNFLGFYQIGSNTLLAKQIMPECMEKTNFRFGENIGQLRGNMTVVAECMRDSLVNYTDAWLDLELMAFPSFEIAWLFGTIDRLYFFNFAKQPATLYFVTEYGTWVYHVNGTKYNISACTDVQVETLRWRYCVIVDAKDVLNYNELTAEINVTKPISQGGLGITDPTTIQKIIIEWEGANYTIDKFNQKYTKWMKDCKSEGSCVIKPFYVWWWVARLEDENGNVFVKAFEPETTFNPLADKL